MPCGAPRNSPGTRLFLRTSPVSNLFAVKCVDTNLAFCFRKGKRHRHLGQNIRCLGAANRSTLTGNAPQYRRFEFDCSLGRKSKHGRACLSAHNGIVGTALVRFLIRPKTLTGLRQANIYGLLNFRTHPKRTARLLNQLPSPSAS